MRYRTAEVAIVERGTIELFNERKLRERDLMAPGAEGFDGEEDAIRPLEEEVYGVVSLFGDTTAVEEVPDFREALGPQLDESEERSGILVLYRSIDRLEQSSRRRREGFGAGIQVFVHFEGLQGLYEGFRLRYDLVS